MPKTKQYAYSRYTCLRKGFGDDRALLASPIYASRACAQYKCTLHAHMYTRATAESRIQYSVINNNSRVRK